MSLNEILERYTRGQPLPKFNEGNYSEDEFPELARMDYTEQDELREHLRDQSYDLNEKLKALTVTEEKLLSDDKPKTES